MSKRVTMPKLFDPPFKALNKSGLVFLLALTIAPLARTTWKLTTVSHARPNLEA